MNRLTDLREHQAADLPIAEVRGQEKYSPSFRARLHDPGESDHTLDQSRRILPRPRGEMEKVEPGAGVFRRFTVTFDYGRQRVYFEPSETPPPRDAFDRTGLWLNRGDGFFEVVDAVVGGPAHEAGIRPGNRVVAVDGSAAARLSLPELRLRLRSDLPATRVRFRISSQGAEKDVTVVLRDLV